MDLRDLPQLVAAHRFVPSNRQIRARNEYWKTQAGNPPADDELATAVNCGAPAAITRWWSTPGFSEWWTNPRWEQEEAQRLLHEAMSRVSDVLRDEEDSGRVIAAAKEAREIYTKLNTTQTTKFADEEIGTMDRKQLEEYIRRSTAAIAPPSPEKKSG